MKNKIYKKVGLLSISALAAFSLAVPAKAEQSCTEYTNYYFFGEINYKNDFKNIGDEPITTGVKFKALPSNATKIKEGKICLKNDKDNCDVFNETWTLEQFYNEVKGRVKYNECENGCPQTDKDNVTYFGGASWYTVEDDGNKESGGSGQNYNSHSTDELIKGTIQPPTTITRTKVENSNQDEFLIKRKHTVVDNDGTLTIDGNSESFNHKWSDTGAASPTVLAPALYKVTYDICTDVKYKAEIEYINKDTKKQVHDPYKKDDLSNGDKDSVDSPKIDGCTLVNNDDSTVDYTIDNADYQKTVYYTCKAESPAVNPKTGNALIFVAWVVGLSSLGYSVYWFKKNKKEEV